MGPINGENVATSRGRIHKGVGLYIQETDDQHNGDRPPIRSSKREQESLALASMARDDPFASSTAAAMRGKVGSEFET